jgi:NitT/TauT family transport system permease protein
LAAQFGWACAGFVLLVAAWQVVVVFARLPADIVPAPASVADQLVRHWAILASNAWVTLQEILLGFVIAVSCGVIVAIGIAFSRTVERLLYPLIVVSQAIPKIVVAPLFLLWFGFGLTTNVLVAMLVAIFPVIVNTTLGLTAIDRDLIRLARVMGGSRARVFLKMRLPYAMPSIFAGLKLAITFATLGAVAGELVAGQAGLGYIVTFASGSLDAALSFAAIVVLSVLGVLLFYAVVAVERVVLGWRPPAEAR